MESRMKSTLYVGGVLLLSAVVLLGGSGCSRMQAQPDANAATAGAPPAANVVMSKDPSLFTVDHPEQFPLAAATGRAATTELVVTGTIMPDVSHNVPVASLASGRVMAIHARLGDTVQKGQTLM